MEILSIVKGITILLLSQFCLPPSFILHRDNLAVLPQMTVLRSKNSKFDDARRATIEVMSRGFYVRWLDEHRIIRLKTFSRRRFSTDEIAYSRALEFARSITPTRNTSTNLSIKSLLN